MNVFLVIKHTHIALVSLSLFGFALRGLAVQLGARWPLQSGVRRFVMVVDTLLLAAGLGLWGLLGWVPLNWLFAKFGWLFAYILLGSLALRRARRPASRFLCFVLALLCAAQMVATARAHNALGLLSWLP